METDKLIQNLKDGRERLCQTHMMSCEGCPMDFVKSPCPIQEAILELMRDANAAEDYEDLRKDFENLEKVKDMNYTAFKSASAERNRAEAQVRRLENELEIMRTKIDVLQQEYDKLDSFILGLVRMTGNDYTIVRHGGYHEISKEVDCATALELIGEAEGCEC